MPIWATYRGTFVSVRCVILCRGAASGRYADGSRGRVVTIDGVVWVRSFRRVVLGGVDGVEGVGDGMVEVHGCAFDAQLA